MSSRPRDRDDDDRHRRRSRSRSPARTRRSDDRQESRRQSSSPARRTHDRQESRRRSSSPGARRDRTAQRRAELTASKVVALEQYRRDYRAGKYARLSYDDKIAMFGCGTMPVLVPLAPGETEDQYETRFRAWLRRVNRPLETLRTSSDPYLERQLRIEFSTANVNGDERFDAFDWADHISHRHAVTDGAATRAVAPHDREASTSKSDVASTPTTMHSERERTGGGQDGTVGNGGHRTETRNVKPGALSCPSKHAEVKRGLSPTALTEAHLACGCTPCLFAVMEQMAERVHEIESAHAATTGAARVVDLTEEV